MKLEAGKTYLTRDGDVTGPLRATYHSHYMWQSPIDGRTWTNEGRIYADLSMGTSPGDIRSEVIPASEAPTRLAHPHAELIKLWADGAEIEYKSPVNGEWCSTKEPTWYYHFNYRVKLEPVPNVVTWHGVDRWTVDTSCMYRSDINAADGQITAILRIEIDHNDPANPMLVSATLEPT